MDSSTRARQADDGPGGREISVPSLLYESGPNSFIERVAMETPEDAVVKKSAFARARTPMTVVTVALVAFGAYYAFFFERKTAYYSQRNARVVAGLADQVRQAIDATADYAKQAANVPDDKQRNQLFLIDSAQFERVQMPAARFKGIEPCVADPLPRRWAESTSSGLRLRFIEARQMLPDPKPDSLLFKADQSAAQAVARKCGNDAQSVSATIDLKELLDPLVRQSS